MQSLVTFNQKGVYGLISSKAKQSQPIIESTKGVFNDIPLLILCHTHL